MNRVLFAPQVRRYINELIPVLFRLGYFSHLEGSRKYVKSLIDNIITDLPTKLHKPASPYFDQFGMGMHYAAFRKNRGTTWYVFFTQYEERGDRIWFVRYLASNHTVAQHLE